MGCINFQKVSFVLTFLRTILVYFLIICSPADAVPPSSSTQQTPSPDSQAEQACSRHRQQLAQNLFATINSAILQKELWLPFEIEQTFCTLCHHLTPDIIPLTRPLPQATAPAELLVECLSDYPVGKSDDELKTLLAIRQFAQIILDHNASFVGSFSTTFARFIKIGIYLSALVGTGSICYLLGKKSIQQNAANHTTNTSTQLCKRQSTSPSDESGHDTICGSTISEILPLSSLRLQTENLGEAEQQIIAFMHEDLGLSTCQIIFLCKALLDNEAVLNEVDFTSMYPVIPDEKLVEEMKHQVTLAEELNKLFAAYNKDTELLKQALSIRSNETESTAVPQRDVAESDEAPSVRKTVEIGEHNFQTSEKVAPLTVQKPVDEIENDEASPASSTNTIETLKFNLQHIVAPENLATLFQALGNQKNIDDVDEDGFNILHYAAAFGEDKLIKSLLNGGADGLTPGPFGRTALTYALNNKHFTTAEWLIDQLTDVNVRTAHNETALHSVAIHGTEDLVHLLLDRGANPNMQDEHGLTPLHMAAIINNVDVATVLIKNKVDVNVQDEFGSTPLHRAKEQGNKEMAKLLLQNGADANIKNIWQNPEHTHQVKNIIYDKSITSKQKMQRCIDLLKSNVMVDANEKLARGLTPLIWALALNSGSNKTPVNSTELVGLLLLRGAKAPATVKPLHFICECPGENAQEIISLLLATQQYDINENNQDNQTPLMLACNTKKPDLELIQFLVANGADISFVLDIVGSENYTHKDIQTFIFMKMLNVDYQ